MPDIIGSTTFNVAAIATAASNAFPPAARMSNPACVARGWAELTMPDVPTAGTLDVSLFLESWSCDSWATIAPGKIESDRKRTGNRFLLITYASNSHGVSGEYRGTMPTQTLLEFGTAHGNTDLPAATDLISSQSASGHSPSLDA